MTRIDPVTNEVTATIDVSPSGTAIIQGAVIADGTLWVSLCEGGLVSVDEQTLAVSEPTALDGCAGTLGFTDESLWVAMDDQRTFRVDPAAGVVTVVVEVGPEDGAPFMATGDGAVWVPLTTGTVARIDTATNTVTEILDLGRTGKPPVSASATSRFGPATTATTPCSASTPSRGRSGSVNRRSGTSSPP